MSIKAAAERLQLGEIVAVPAEGVYGYSVDALNPRALERVVTYKGRTERKKLIILIGDLAQLSFFCPPLSSRDRDKLLELWAVGQPPTSVVLPALPDLSDFLTAGTGTVTVRLPQPEDMLALLAAFGGPLVSTSANKSGEPPVYDMADLPPDLYALACERELSGGVSRIYDMASGQWLR